DSVAVLCAKAYARAAHLKMHAQLKPISSAHKSSQNRKKSFRIRKPDEKPDGKPETGFENRMWSAIEAALVCTPCTQRFYEIITSVPLYRFRRLTAPCLCLGLL